MVDSTHFTYLLIFVDRARLLDADLINPQIDRAVRGASIAQRSVEIFSDSQWSTIAPDDFVSHRAVPAV